MGTIFDNLVNNPQVEWSRGTAVTPLISFFVWFSAIVIVSAWLFQIAWILIFLFIAALILGKELLRLLNSKDEVWKLFPEKAAVDLQRQTHELGSKDNLLDLGTIEEGDLAIQPIKKKAEISAKARIVK